MGYNYLKGILKNKSNKETKDVGVGRPNIPLQQQLPGNGFTDDNIDNMTFST